MSINHIFREGNQVADKLSKIGRDFPVGYHVIPSTPSIILELVQNDARGTVYERNCNVSFVVR